MSIDVIVANLLREGINKHRARELAEHFIKHMEQKQEPVAYPENFIDALRYDIALRDFEHEQAQKKQEIVAYTGNGTAGREADVRPTGFFFQADKKQEPVAWQVKYRDDNDIPQIAWFPHPVHPESALAKRPYIEEPLYTAPPQAQKQEPAWYHAECDDPDHSGFFKEAIDAVMQVNEHGGFVTQLYTSPPASVNEAPQRQPLTDEQITDAFFKTETEMDNSFGNFQDGVRYAEAAHGITGEQK